MGHRTVILRSGPLFLLTPLVVLLVSCAPVGSVSTSEREAVAAATIAAARATEAAAAKTIANLTPAAALFTMSKTISSSSGGSVELGDGTRVEIPPGALSQDTQLKVIRLTQLPDQANLSKESAYQAYEIASDAVPLRKPITLTFSYGALPMSSALTPDAILVGRWNGKNWEYVGGETDPLRKTISVTTDHLSLFTISVLPDIDTLVSRMKSVFATCGKGESAFDPEWTNLVARIGAVSGNTEAARGARVYNWNIIANGWADRDGRYIAVDRYWLEGAAGWLPAADRQLLVAPILAHELSHTARGTTDLEISAELLRRSIGLLPVDEVLRTWRGVLAQLFYAIGTGSCNLVATVLINMGSLVNPLVLGSCDTFQAMEFRADLDGVSWAGHYVDQASRQLGVEIDGQNAVGLVFTAFMERVAQMGDCTHPSTRLRAEEVRSKSGMGVAGGIVGQVQPQVAGVDVTVDGRSRGQTGGDGRFLVTGLQEGEHSVGFVKAGYASVVIKVNIQKQHLVELRVGLPSATATATPIPKPMFTVREPTVNVRSGPGTNYPVVGQLRQGDQFEITGRNPAGDWWQFTYNGQPAWVSASLVAANVLPSVVPVVVNIPTPPPTSTRVPTATPVPPEPSPLPPPPPASSVLSSGRIDVSLVLGRDGLYRGSFDLESGTATRNPDSLSDIEIVPEGFSPDACILWGLGGMRLAAINAQVGLEGCKTVNFDRRELAFMPSGFKDYLHIDALQTGQWFCGVTREGHYAEFRVQIFGDMHDRNDAKGCGNQATIIYTTWR